LTQAQIQAQAAAQAQAAQAPIRADIEQQASEAAAANTAQGQAIIQLSQALAKELGGIAPQIEATYRSAAQDQSAFAAGFSKGLQDLQQQGQTGINADLRNIGAPEGQMLEPSAASGDFLFGLGGYLPGQTFSREGAAFTSAAHFLPGTALLQGQRDYGVNVAEGRKQQKEFERYLRRLDDEYPGLLQKAVDELNDQQLQVFAAYLQGEYLKLALRKGGAEITGIDPATGLPTYEATQDVAAAAEKKKSAKQKKIDKRNTAWDEFYGSIDADADNFFKEVQDPNSLTPGAVVRKPTKNRTQAFAILWRKYGNKLIRLGANKAKVRAAINKALTDAGYPKPKKPPTDNYIRPNPIEGRGD
jgi:hypothetical protein